MATNTVVLNDFGKGKAITVRVKMTKRFKIRICIALGLIRLASWFLKQRIEISRENEELGGKT